MNISRILRFLAAALIIISGIAHLGAGLSLAGTDIGSLIVGIAFGVIYIAIGVGLLVGKRLFSYMGVIFPLVGGIGGSYNLFTSLSTGASILEPIIIALLSVIAIDVIVILCCGYLLLHKINQLDSK
jgi:hypothetical protein